jgi:hypothetical protein
MGGTDVVSPPPKPGAMLSKNASVLSMPRDQARSNAIIDLLSQSASLLGFGRLRRKGLIGLIVSLS